MQARGSEPGVATVLVVDDDGHIREVVRFSLEQAGYRVLEAADGRAAVTLFREHPVDVVVLDIIMPEQDGLEVCRRLRERSQVPILFLSSRDDELDRVLGLEIGADDYVTKPFSPRELTLRVQAVLRRARAAETAAAPPQPVRSGRLEVDVAARRARCDGRELDLTVREFDLLAFFVSHPGRAFTRAELLEQVWGWSFGDLSTITVYVRRLRDKVEREPASPAQLQTVWGVGYRWEAKAS